MKSRSLLLKGDIERTMILIDKSVDVYKQKQVWDYLANAYNLKTIAFDRMERFDEAIVNYRKVIHVGTYLENKSVLVKGLNKILLTFLNAKRKFY